MNDMNWLCELDEVGDILLGKLRYVEEIREIREKISNLENEINYIETELLNDLKVSGRKQKSKKQKHDTRNEINPRVAHRQRQLA